VTFIDGLSTPSYTFQVMLRSVAQLPEQKLKRATCVVGLTS
jgi:hypothetical protein